MKLAGGFAINAIDRNAAQSAGFQPGADAVGLAMADVVLSGVQAGLDRLANAFQVGLRLSIGAKMWQADGGPDGFGGQVDCASGRLDGLPDNRSAALDAALIAFLQVASSQHRADLRLAASDAVLFEARPDGSEDGWRSIAAERAFTASPDLPVALAASVSSAIARPATPVDALVGQADGRNRVFQVTALPSDRTDIWLIRVVDHTVIDRAMAKIERRDILLRRLFDLSPVGIVLLDFETGQITEANQAFMTFGEWRREDLIGATIGSLLSRENGVVVERAVADLQRSGRFGPFEQVFLRPDGTPLPTVLRGLLLAGGDGREIVWLMVEDVSEQQAHLSQMQAVRDEALRARAELDTAVQALPHGFMLCDAEDRIVLVNEQMSKVYPELASSMIPGRKYVDMLRDGVMRGMFPQAFGREEDFIAEIMACRTTDSVDHRIELAEGKLLRVVERATPLGGRVGLRIDVTAEHDSERRLTQVIEGSQAGTWECDFQTGANRVNDRWAQMLGWTREELEPITLTSWEALLHPEDRERTLTTVDRVLQGQTDLFDVVFRLSHRDGHWVWVQSRGRVSLRAPDGRPVRMSGVHVDVSALKAAEERLEQIIEGAEVGTWYHDIREGMCFVNDLWVSMLGYTADEISPVTDEVWLGLLHPDDKSSLQRNMTDRFARGQWQFQDELRLRHKAGHWVWILSRGRVTAWDKDGTPIATSGVHLDVSARKRLEGDLEVERDFLSTLMETSISGIIAVDDKDRIVFFNREVQRIFEMPSEDLLNQVCDPVKMRMTTLDGLPVSFADLPCQLVQARAQILRDLRMRVAMADGRIKVVSVNAAVLPDPGMTARVVCTVTDVTATARAEDELRAAIDRAEAANRAKSQFLANMSHELRTPLNGVLGMADLLSESRMDSAQRAMLDTIRESGAHLLSVVNDILDLSKIESGKLALDLRPLRLTELATRIETMHGLAARQKGVGLCVTFGAGVDKLRMGDPTRVLQILHNLVGNAVKFTEAGTVVVMIGEMPGLPDRLMIEVSDTGIGMSDDQTARVFDEFIQGDGSITRRFGGTGLGLPIVRRLVGLMGGTISLVSAPAKGTTVTVALSLPVVRGDVPPPEVVQRLTPVSFAGASALLAEDNATNRLILRAMLTRLGIRVVLAEDGDAAVDLWAPGRFDVVLLDISMPRKDGVSALAELTRKAGPAGLPPVIAVTANAMAHHQLDYRAAGFAEVVTKPVTLDALAQSLRRALEGRIESASRRMALSPRDKV